MKKLTLKRKLHEIRLTEHRFLVWVLAVSIFVGIALVGYIVVTDEEFVRVAVEHKSDVNAWKNYRNRTLGFSLRYPPTWVLESPEPNLILFESSEDLTEQVSVSVLEAQDEPAIREALNKVEEELVPVGEIDGPRIVNRLASGEREIVVLVQPAERLFVIRGTSNYFDDIISTIKFLPNE